MLWQRWKIMKNAILLPFPSGWAGIATAFPPPPNYENSSQTGSKEFDSTLDRLWHPMVYMWDDVLSAVLQKIEIMIVGREKKMLIPASSFFIMWFLDIYVCVCFTGERGCWKDSPDKNQGRQHQSIKACIVSRNSTSAFEEKHQEASALAIQNN